MPISDTSLSWRCRETGFRSLWRYDIPSGRFEELIYSAVDHDLSGAILSQDSSRLLGVTYFDDYREEHYFDEDEARKAETIHSSFPNHTTWIASRSRDGRRLLVGATSDVSPPKYFTLDLDSRSGSLWYSTYPYLEQAVLVPKQRFEFKASDGMTLNGYLTLPVDGNQKPSLVVFPHGGPSSRDYRYFDPFVQFFANRGFAVLQVNFRGSDGFGDAYQRAGYREWAKRMQQDIYEAVDWLGEKGSVDVDRKCIVGASYGGYAALTAAYQQPVAYRCVVSIAGVSDLYDFAWSNYRYLTLRPYIREAIGHPRDGDDKRMLRERSPVKHVEAMRAPLLVIHGTADIRVNVRQARHFVERAREAGNDVEYIELADGTHSVDDYDNRLAVFSALDAFLGEHLGYEPGISN